MFACNVFLQATGGNISLTDKFSYLPPLKAKLPTSKQHKITPTAKTLPVVSVTPTKLQYSSSARKSFSPDKSLQVASTSKAYSSTPTKPQPASLSVESSYYHEVDSDFLDFDSWSPDMPVSMLTPLSPTNHDIQMSHSRTSIPPQSSSLYKKETFQPTINNTPSIKTVDKNNNNNNKQFTKAPKQTNENATGISNHGSLPKNDPCSFFTAGSTK